MGETEEKFFVHKQELIAHFEHFKEAIINDWDEGLECTVRLPEAESTAFMICAKWLRTGSIHYCIQDGNAHRTFDTLGAAYLLGNFLFAPDFQDAVIDAVIASSVRLKKGPPSLVASLYPLCPRESAHSTISGDYVYGVLCRNKFNQLHNYHLPQEFFEELLAVIGPKLREGVPGHNAKAFFEGNNICMYHEQKLHERPCYRAKFGL